MVKQPPKNLSAEAKSWWKKITTEYDISDEAGFLILQTALEAFQTMREAQKIIKKEGMTNNDRFGQPRMHPACTIERDARGQFMQGLKALNLDIEPLRDVGRPGGK